LLNEPLSRPGMRWLFLACIYFIVASASFSGYFAKWQFREDMPLLFATEASLPAMVDGVADRPYVYRQLLPIIANSIESALPIGVRDRVTALLFDEKHNFHPIAAFYPNAVDARNPRYALRYYLIYAMSFGSLLLAMFALRAVCIDVQPNRIAATLAPIAFAAILPLILTVGGYFYDPSELLFMAIAVWLSMRGRVLWLIAITALATLNKESFFFFILTLFPFLRSRFLVKATLAVQCVLLVVAAAVNVVIKLKYAHNGGGVVTYHLMENLVFLIHPSSYIGFEYNYGIPMTKGFNVINIILVAAVVRTAWGKLLPAVRQHLKIALLVNVPLFLAFCYPGELRNFSMLNVGFVITICVSIAAYLDRSYRALPAAVVSGDAVPERTMPAAAESISAHSNNATI
jgi:hypothetical protein